MADYTHLRYYPNQPSPTPGPSAPRPPNHPNPYPTSHQDDLKYLEKYKELKRKVKETELDNDRLQLKVLKTRKNIQRLRLERAILYERLATMRTSDTVAAPVPSTPAIFSSAQPPLPRHPLQDPVHYENIPESEAAIESVPQTAVRSRHPLAPPATSNSPERRHTQRPERSPHAGASRSHKAPAPEPESASSSPAPPSAATQSPEVARTFPFVLEYAHGPVTPVPMAAYPTEVRFYPYESSTYQVHRGRRDAEHPANATRSLERELKFRHHRPETQTQPQTNSPSATQGDYEDPPQRPFLSPGDVRRNTEVERAAHGSHVSDKYAEVRTREPSNGARKTQDGERAVHQQDHKSRRQHDATWNLPAVRRRSNSRSEQDPDKYAREMRARQQSTSVCEENVDRGAPPRVQEGEAME